MCDDETSGLTTNKNTVRGEKNASKVSSQRTIVNEGSEDEFSCTGFKRHIPATILFYFFGVITGGFVFLLGYWYPVRRLKLTHRACDIRHSSTLLIKHTDGRYFVSNVKNVPLTEIHNDLISTDALHSLVDLERTLVEQKTLRCFEHLYVLYYWCNNQESFYELYDLQNQLTHKDMSDRITGVPDEVRALKTKLFGENIIKVPFHSYPVVFLQQAANPFYVFQVFACTVWIVDEYVVFAVTIICISLLSLLFSTYQTRSYMKKLHEMVARVDTVSVLTPGLSEPVDKSSIDLLPGDVFVVPEEGMSVLCDAVVLSGRVVVNESALTGESYPVTKTEVITSERFLANKHIDRFSTSKYRIHSLYNGTEVVLARPSNHGERVLAMVICTGYNTSKGRLMRSIIHPSPVHFHFFRDSFRFILVLAFLALLGFFYTLAIFTEKGESPAYTARKALDIITIAIPPALPFAMTIGLVYALRRLQARGIYCIDPPRVNMCGKLKLFVFDKTGTLTEDHLTVSTVLHGKSLETAHAARELASTSILKEEITYRSKHLPANYLSKEECKPVFEAEVRYTLFSICNGFYDFDLAMASCHSLSKIHDKVSGNPLEQYMFGFTGWSLHEPHQGNKDHSKAIHILRPPQIEQSSESAMQLKETEIAVLWQFPFESIHQRMSVIVQNLNSQTCTVYSKGAPERIIQSCISDSVPSNVYEILAKHTRTGHRVLAIAEKTIGQDVEKIPRSEIEEDLTFLGLIVFENVLKFESKHTIQTLHDANIRCIMATGDNLLTGVCIARECGMILNHQNVIEADVQDGKLGYKLLMERSERQESNKTSHKSKFFCDFTSLRYCLALSGNTYMTIREEHADILEKILMSTTVYARMSPSQKAVLIEDLKTLGYTTGMCGDGANDCGALKAAHAGIALSESEASVASPFTSKVFNISCVPRLIREGRCALVTSFSSFKYMALYSMIQYVGVLILNSVNSNYSDYQFLYADLAVVVSLTAAMVQSNACQTLATKRPPGRLVHPVFVLSLVFQILIQFTFQFIGFIYSQNVPYYQPPDFFPANKKHSMPFECYENYAVITISFFQYIFLSIAFSTGRPYRENLFLNLSFVTVFLMCLGATLFMAIHPVESIRSLMAFIILPSRRLSWVVLALSAASAFASIILEKVVIPSHFFTSVLRLLRRKTEPKNKYKLVFSDMLKDSHWPPCR